MLLEVPPKIAGDMAFDQEKARRLIAGAPDQGFVSESDSNEILTAYGLPMIRTQIATTAAQATRIAGEIGYPVVMKLHSPDITHKTDAGGVRLDLRGDADVGEGFFLGVALRPAPGKRGAGNGVAFLGILENDGVVDAHESRAPAVLNQISRRVMWCLTR